MLLLSEVVSCSHGCGGSSLSRSLQYQLNVADRVTKIGIAMAAAVLYSTCIYLYYIYSVYASTGPVSEDSECLKVGSALLMGDAVVAMRMML
jgi:hypothetical protein